jgi:hypothetical protein
VTEFSQIAVGTPVRFKSGLGYTYEGTVTAGPDSSDRYAVVIGSGATATVDRDKMELIGGPAKPDPDMTPAQLAASREERLTQAANRAATDAMMALYAQAREWERAEGGDPTDTEVDALRIRVTAVFAEEAAKLRDAMAEQIADKQRRPAPEPAPISTPEEGVTDG